MIHTSLLTTALVHELGPQITDDVFEQLEVLFPPPPLCVATFLTTNASLPLVAFK